MMALTPEEAGGVEGALGLRLGERLGSESWPGPHREGDRSCGPLSGREEHFVLKVVFWWPGA